MRHGGRSLSRDALGFGFRYLAGDEKLIIEINRSARRAQYPFPCAKFPFEGRLNRPK